MKTLSRNILVPINFKLESLVALDNTYEIAKMFDARIVLLYVIPPVDFITEFFHTEEEVQAIEKEAYKRLKELAESVHKKTGLEVDISVKRGKVFEQINVTANEIDARYVIVGQKIPAPGQPRRLGTIITQIVKYSCAPVIVVKGHPESKISFKSICLPLDLTENTRIQLFNAMTFAMHYKSKINLVSVLMGGIKMTRSRIYRKLRKAEKLLKENGIDTSMEIYKRSEKSIAEVILEHSVKVKADIIFIMTHRETVSNDNYIGAVAANIINDADIPVISFTSAASHVDNAELIKPVWDPFNIWSK